MTDARERDQPEAHIRAEPSSNGMSFVRWLARGAVWLFYRTERIGPALPAGPLVLVANHPNALLDPAIVMATSERHLRFLAKSTLFGIPLVGGIVRASGAIPVYRRMDPGVDVSKNADMFRAVSDVLAMGGAVCVFPEGISHSRGRLAPLKSGTSRMLLDARARGAAVTLVPVGLNFDEKTSFRSTVTVAYGPPLGEAEIAALVSGVDARQAADRLTGEAERRLRDVMIEADPDGTQAIVDDVERLYASARALPRHPADTLARRRRIAEGIDVMRRHDPARFAALYERYRTFTRRLGRFGIGPRLLARDVSRGQVARFALREAAMTALTVPFIVVAALLFVVPYLLVDLVSKRASVEMAATVKVFSGAVFYPLTIAAWAVLAGRWSGATAGWVTLGLLPLVGIFALYAIERESAVAGIVREWVGTASTSPVTRTRLRRQGSDLAEMLDEADRWLQAIGRE